MNPNMRRGLSNTGNNEVQQFAQVVTTLAELPTWIVTSYHLIFAYYISTGIGVKAATVAAFSDLNDAGLFLVQSGLTDQILNAIQGSGQSNNTVGMRGAA